MTQPVLYGIRNCDTVKQARAWLEQHGVAYDFHAYKSAGIDPGCLERWCAEVGWEALLNRAGTTFRKLEPSHRESLDETNAWALMLAQPYLYRSLPW